MMCICFHIVFSKGLKISYIQLICLDCVSVHSGIGSGSVLLLLFLDFLFLFFSLLMKFRASSPFRVDRYRVR